MNILFRADSSYKIGTGHIMRDLVLANQYSDSKISFATQNLKGNINFKIEEAGFNIINLKSNKIEELTNIIRKYNINMIVFDHYEVDYSYEKELKDKTNIKILSFDDTYEKHYCDILLNHNINGDPKRYKNLVPHFCELRCGKEYTLLRDEFILEKKNKIIKNNTLSKVKIVFLAMGGADHSNLNIKIMDVLGEFNEIKIIVVTTSANKNIEDLKKYVSDKNNISLHINSNEIAKLMNQSDFAIITPSVTVNEVIYMELPFIAIKTAENQSEMYNYLKDNIFFVLDRFNKDKFKKKLIQLKSRINMGKNIQLIRFETLNKEDLLMILDWRNNKNISKWMYNKNIITTKEHFDFIEKLKNNQNKRYLLVRRNNENIGVISFTNINYRKKIAEMGIYANPTIRGVGNLLMNEIKNYAFTILKIDTIIAEVFSENNLAIKLYERFNFKKISNTGVNNNLIHMELNK